MFHHRVPWHRYVHPPGPEAPASRGRRSRQAALIYRAARSRWRQHRAHAARCGCGRWSCITAARDDAGRLMLELNDLRPGSAGARRECDLLGSHSCRRGVGRDRSSSGPVYPGERTPRRSTLHRWATLARSTGRSRGHHLEAAAVSSRTAVAAPRCTSGADSLSLSRTIHEPQARCASIRCTASPRRGLSC